MTPQKPNPPPATAGKGEVPPRIYAREVTHISCRGAGLAIQVFYDDSETKALPCFPDLTSYVPESALTQARAEARAEAFEEASMELNQYENALEYKCWLRSQADKAKAAGSPAGAGEGT